jgi:hypothetical protein
LIAKYFVSTAIDVMHSLTIPYGANTLYDALAIPFVAILFALAALVPGAGGLVLVTLGFLFALPLLNAYIGVRHVVMVTPFVLALSVQGGRGLLERHKLAEKAPAFFKREGRRLKQALAVAVVALAAYDVYWLVWIKVFPMNTSYVSIERALKQVVKPGDLIATSYPQLISLLTGERALGTTFLYDDHEELIKAHHPSLILFDDARDGPLNYFLFLKNKHLKLDGYSVVAHDPREHFVLLRATKAE